MHLKHHLIQIPRVKHFYEFLEESNSARFFFHTFGIKLILWA